MESQQTTQVERSEGTPRVDAVGAIEEYLGPSTREDRVAALVFFDLGARGGPAAAAIRSVLWEQAKPYAEGLGWEKEVGQQDSLEAVVAIHTLLHLWRQEERPVCPSKASRENNRVNEDLNGLEALLRDAHYEAAAAFYAGAEIAKSRPELCERIAAMIKRIMPEFFDSMKPERVGGERLDVECATLPAIQWLRFLDGFKAAGGMTTGQ